MLERFAPGASMVELRLHRQRIQGDRLLGKPDVNGSGTGWDRRPLLPFPFRSDFGLLHPRESHTQEGVEG